MRAEKEIQPRYTADEYLKMERASEVRHEYLDGEIFEMAGETIPHGRISSNLVVQLGLQLRGKNCDVFTKDMKVRSGSLPSPRRIMKGLFSYPDVVIICGTPQVHDEYTDILLNPNVIIEALSDATEKFDRGEKFERYREHLPSLTDYILVAQHKPYIEHFTRTNADEWRLTSRKGLDAELQIVSVDCRLLLSDIYDRVEFPTAPDEDAEEISEEQ